MDRFTWSNNASGSENFASLVAAQSVAIYDGDEKVDVLVLQILF